MKLQKMSSQQAYGAEQPADPLNCGLKQVPFGLLLPTLTAQLDKDRSVQLHTLFAKLRRNEISKEGFTRHMKGIVGDKMLRMAISKLQQMKANPANTGIHAPGHSNNPRMSSAVTETSVQNSHSDPCGIPVNQVPSSNSGTLSTSAPMQGLNKHPQQHMQLPLNSFPMYGTVSGSFRSLSGSNINTSGSSLKQQLHGSQMRQMNNQSVGSTPFEGSTHSATNMMAIPKFERPPSTHHQRIVQSGSISHFQSSSSLPLNSASWQGSATKVQTTGSLSPIAYLKQGLVDQTLEQPQKPLLSVQKDLSSAPNEQSNATPGVLKDDLEKQPFIMGLTTSTNMMQTSSIAVSPSSQLDSGATLNSCVTFGTSPAGVNVRTPPNKPSVGQKKSLDALGSSPQPSSKKQKASGASLDRSIEQLKDVTAVSGINLREEEEQLFSGPEEDSCIPEASKRVAQEEEERLILQESPTQKKLAEIMTRSGLTRISNDFERCLSLCVEERMRGLMSSIMRFSRQRVDAEKPRHQTFITSVFWQQINEMNQKAKEEWLMRQAEPEKLKKLNEPEGDGGVDTEEGEDNRSKLTKAYKEDDDKMRTTAANVAALAAVGGDDMLSKWQLMAEQARQKREGGTDATSCSQSGEDGNQKPTSAAGRNIKDSQEGSRRGSAAGSGRKFEKSQGSTQEPEGIRMISVKDVISVLEREPQMCNSTLIYRFYDRICSSF